MMEHKAFLFDYNHFERELKETLEDALASGGTNGLVSFINTHLSDLRDPNEGEPLGDDWESLIGTHDAHQYGDFALTKYYDPLADIGLGATWGRVQELISNDPTLMESPILGSTLGPKSNPFDPGKMGAYFQTARQVRHNCRYMSELAKTKRLDDLNKAVQMLEEAMKGESGLFITF